MVDRLGSLGSRKVCEFFAGDGQMYDSIWSNARSVVGFDIDPGARGKRVIHCDANIACQWIDVDSFSIFDVDPYSNPYRILWVLSERKRTDKKIGLAITDGLLNGFRKMQTRLADVPFSRQMLDATGWSPEAPPSLTKETGKVVQKRCLGTWFDELHWYCFVSGGTGVSYSAAIVS